MISFLPYSLEPPNPAPPLGHTTTHHIPHKQNICSSLLLGREMAARERSTQGALSQLQKREQTQIQTGKLRLTEATRQHCDI